jgi:signal transduction histidine kinase
MMATSSTSITIDYIDFDSFSPLLAKDITHNPDEMLSAFNGEWKGEMHQTRRDGVEITVESRWTLVRDEQGQPKSILVINTDITEKKRMESQFLRAQRLESIGTLASGVSHDLNNVFGPMMMSLEVFRKRLKDDGIDIARRTVAKYREALRIPSSVMRRRQKRLAPCARV